ncbi:MAG: hypothetical protein OWQ52_02940 [Metallosphaera prunae]|uniref:type III-G CRISPR-associated protein Csx26 n=1 Tax=Metallosphaera prunae TaxID=47304 RepID=UPI0022756287|nr:hypothetical protein [Metallosphaera prunae]MCY0861363.1 hypothetical protein [Metallosphaera prunae]
MCPDFMKDVVPMNRSIRCTYPFDKLENKDDVIKFLWYLKTALRCYILEEKCEGLSKDYRYVLGSAKTNMSYMSRILMSYKEGVIEISCYLSDRDTCVQIIRCVGKVLEDIKNIQQNTKNVEQHESIDLISATKELIKGLRCGGIKGHLKGPGKRKLRRPKVRAIWAKLRCQGKPLLLNKILYILP